GAHTPARAAASGTDTVRGLATTWDELAAVSRPTCRGRAPRPAVFGTRHRPRYRSFPDAVVSPVRRRRGRALPTSCERPAARDRGAVPLLHRRKDGATTG